MENSKKHLQAASCDGSSDATKPPVDDRDPVVPRRFKIDPTGKGGRPRGSKNHKTIMRKVAYEQHVIVEKGRRRRMSTLELVLHALRELVFSEKPRAMDFYLQFLSKYRPEPETGCGYIVAPAPMSTVDWIREQMELNKTREPPEDYKGD